jgi:branched-chain amino acid transport system substrate-binding protein
VLAHLREKGFEGTICAASSFNSGQVIEHNPELFEDVYFPQPAFDLTDERPVAQQFVQAYQQRYNQDPDIYAAHAFDAITVVMKVFTEAPRLEYQELRKSMQFNVKEIPGVTGIIQFDDFGDVHHNPVMFVIKDGKVLNHQKYVEEQRKLIQQRIRDLLAS